MTFFHSYYEYAKTLKKSVRHAFYDAILEYFFDGIEPKSENPAYGAWLLVKPTIDANLARTAAGRRGGSNGRGEVKARKSNQNAAKDETTGGGACKQNASTLAEENASKTQAKRKQNASKTQGIIGIGIRIGRASATTCAPAREAALPEIPCPAHDPDPLPEPDGEPAPPPATEPVRRPDVPDEATVVGIATSAMGVSEDFARWWYSEMQARDWTGTDGRRVDLRNWRPMLKAWYNRRRPDEVRDAEHAATTAKLAARTFKPEDWRLCEERCSRFANGKCTRGVKTPPDKEQYPKPPEECEHFRA